MSQPERAAGQGEGIRGRFGRMPTSAYNAEVPALSLGRTLVVPLALSLALVGCGEDIRTDPLKGRLEIDDRVEFGDVQVGIARTAELAIQNVGQAGVGIVDIRPESLREDVYEFRLSDRSFTIAAGGTHPLEITFLALGEMAEPIVRTIEIVTDQKADDGTPLIIPVELSGRGIRSGIRVEPEPLDFGTVLIGSSKTMTLTFTNDLSRPAPLTTRVDGQGQPEIANQSGQGRFEVLTPLPLAGALVDAPLAPGAQVHYDVRYTPAATQDGRDDRGIWIVSNCENLACDRRIEVRGRGTNAALECSPSPLDFGDVNPGSAVELTVRCTNLASESVTITDWDLEAGTSREFSVTPYDGNVTALEPGAGFDVAVQFQPTAQNLGGLLTGRLMVRGRNPRANVDLTTTFVDLRGTAGGPNIVVRPAMLSFGPTAIGSTSKLRILVENAGHRDLTVSNVEGDTSSVGYFTVDQNALVVPTGDAKVIEVSYTPLTEGDHVSGVTLESDDPDTPSLNVPITGEGRDLLPCAYLVTPESIGFGVVEVLRQTSQGLRVHNIGENDCLINNLQVALGSSDAFHLSDAAPSSIVLAPGETQTVVVEYVPESEGEHTGFVSFYISDPLRSTPEIPLHGVGTSGALLISPGELDFGRVGLGCSTRDRRITVYNTGTTPTTVDAIETPQGVSSEFMITQLPNGLPTPGAVVSPGQSIEFSVLYQAQDEGIDTGFLHVIERGRSHPFVVPLYGEGAATPINEDTFTQLESPEVDILFVIDNSCSMADEQASLAGNFSSFISFADSQQLDYRIGVISTDTEAGLPGPRCPVDLPGARPVGLAQGACGYFADGNADGSALDPAWRLIDPNEQPSPVEAFASISQQGTAGSGNEQGLEAAYDALSSPLITDWNSGFLRPDAYLALVFVSDEDDHSPRSVSFYTNYFRAIKGARNAQLFSASAIVGDPQTGCGLQAEPGTRYIQLAQDTGGIFESICTQNWSRALENLGRTVFGYKSNFFLSNQPVPGTVEVEVDGVVVAQTLPSGQTRWTYDATTNSVSFAPLAIPEPGSDIVIRYEPECL